MPEGGRPGMAGPPGAPRIQDGRFRSARRGGRQAEAPEEETGPARPRDQLPPSQHAREKTEQRGNLRILMVIAQYTPIVGGAERQAHRLARSLVAHGCKVTVLTGRWHRENPRQEIIDGVEVIRHTTGADWLWRFKAGHLLKHYLWEASLFATCLRFSRQHDILHVHQALHAAFVTCFANILIGKKIIVKVACGGDLSDVKMMRRNKVSPFGSLFWRCIKRQCTRIVAINKEIESELLDDGFPPERIVAIPNGIAAETVVPTRDYALHTPLRIVSVGRLDPQKGFDVLINAIARITHHSIRCAIYGSGKSAGDLAARIREHNLDNRVQLRGVTDDLLSRLHHEDIFVLASRAEGLSNALLEAMACGLPCIATHIGGNTDLIAAGHSLPPPGPGRWQIAANGILVAKEDPAALAGAIEALANDTELRQRLGRQARRWVQRHCSLEAVTRRYLGLYHELLST